MIDENSALEKVRFGSIELIDLDWNAALHESEAVPLASASPAVRAHEILEEVRTWPSSRLEARKKAVRNMLRNGKYTPAGRAKPSSEYLLHAALDGDFPTVNFFVDQVNLASLRYLYPMSIFDLDKAGWRLGARLGRPSESYIFNASGQSIELENLVCICAYSKISDDSTRAILTDSTPIANPVRDSMATKVFDGARNAVVVVYAPRNDDGDLHAALHDVSTWCSRACRMVRVQFLPHIQGS